MKFIKAATAVIILLVTSNLAFATGTKVKDCSTAQAQNKGNYDRYGYDYGNATGQEASACHSSNYWQRFGSESTREKTQTESDLDTNDGVSWRTSTNGTDWTEWTSGELSSGGFVQFQFDVNRAIYGNHKYDQLEAWVDWNQDGVWNDSLYTDSNATGEQIYSKQWQKHESHDVINGVEVTAEQTWNNLDWTNNKVKQNWSGGNGTWNHDSNKLNSQDSSATFTTSAIEVPVVDALTQVWLRARIVCENSLERFSDGMNLIATGFQNQGETEDYLLTVATKAAKPVPEPSTLFIFALGLIAFVTRRKKV